MIACFHSTAGFGMAALVTAVPIQILDVPAASAAGVVRPSSQGPSGMKSGAKWSSSRGLSKPSTSMWS